MKTEIKLLLAILSYMLILILPCRLGEAEKALYHYKHAGNIADSNDISEAEALNQRLKRCSDARKSNEWNALLRETQCAITSGVDSAPEVSFL